MDIAYSIQNEWTQVGRSWFRRHRTDREDQFYTLRILMREGTVQQSTKLLVSTFEMKWKTFVGKIHHPKVWEAECGRPREIFACLMHVEYNMTCDLISPGHGPSYLTHVSGMQPSGFIARSSGNPEELMFRTHQECIELTVTRPGSEDQRIWIGSWHLELCSLIVTVPCWLR